MQSEYSFQIEFRGYQGLRNCLKGVLKRDLKAGIGFIRFEGALDTNKVFNSLNNYFVEARFNSARPGLELPEMLLTQNDKIHHSRGSNIPYGLPTILVINSPKIIR